MLTVFVIGPIRMRKKWILGSERITVTLQSLEMDLVSRWKLQSPSHQLHSFPKKASHSTCSMTFQERSFPSYSFYPGILHRMTQIWADILQFVPRVDCVDSPNKHLRKFSFKTMFYITCLGVRRREKTLLKCFLNAHLSERKLH